MQFAADPSHFCQRHGACFCSGWFTFPPKPQTMISTRAHFWLRLAALTAILLAEAGPHLWNAGQASPFAASAATSSVVADR
jgi:hypothetical protein